MPSSRARKLRRDGQRWDPDRIDRGNYPPTEGQRRALYALSRKLRCPLPSVRTVAEASRELRRLGRQLQHRPPQ